KSNTSIRYFIEKGIRYFDPVKEYGNNVASFSFFDASACFFSYFYRLEVRLLISEIVFRRTVLNHVARYNVAVFWLWVDTYVGGTEFIFLKHFQSFKYASGFRAEMYRPFRFILFTPLEPVYAGTFPAVYLQFDTPRSHFLRFST